jgi:hypothetical protein
MFACAHRKNSHHPLKAHKICTQNSKRQTIYETPKNWSFIIAKLCQFIITGLCGASVQTPIQFNDTSQTTKLTANHLSPFFRFALIKCRIFKYY